MTINLGTGPTVPRVALVQMPNGTGKTTTLSLLKATLTGEASDWSAARIVEMRRLADPRDTGNFEVELRVDDRPLTLALELDFDLGRATYSTTAPDVGGYNRGWVPPPGVRRFLNRRFVDLFIFDGELANRLLDPAESRADEAIETLCQLDLLDEIKKQADAYWERATASGGASTQMGLSRYQKIAGKLASRLATLRSGRQESANELAAVSARISKLDERISQQIQADEQNREAHSKATAGKAAVDEEVNAAVQAVMGRVRRPETLSVAFTAALRSVKSNLDRVKLPDSTSRQFFAELAEEPMCVCGRPISAHERQQILARAEHFLGEDLAGVLNSMKHDIDLLSADEPRSALTTALDELKVLRTRSDALETELSQIAAISLSKSEEDLSGVSAEIETLKNQQRTLQEQLEVLDGPATRADSQLITSHTDIDRIVVIKSAESQLKLARDEIAQISGTLELRQRIELLKKVLNDARTIARDRLKQVLVKSCNEKLAEVLRGDPVYIDKIQRSLVLHGRSSGSVGQNLAIGYTFLAEALHRGTHTFPLIVDSPAGPLDHQVRREVASMVPKLCTQFIAFTISTEREAFLEPLEVAAEQDVRYITAFRKTAGNADLMKELPVTSVDNGQSVVVEGRDYFVRFAKEAEVDERSA